MAARRSGGGASVCDRVEQVAEDESGVAECEWYVVC